MLTDDALHISGHRESGQPCCSRAAGGRFERNHNVEGLFARLAGTRSDHPLRKKGPAVPQPHLRADAQEDGAQAHRMPMDRVQQGMRRANDCNCLEVAICAR